MSAAASQTKLQPPQGAPAPAASNTQGRPGGGRMKLASVVKGRLAKPLRVLMYGVEGVGKSTFAGSAPAPIFVGAEDGTSELDVARFPEPSTWAEALEAIAELTNAEHEYKTLVVDTLDWLEPLCWAHVCATKKDRNGKPFKDIEDIGYGKGYAAALDEWRLFLAALDRLRAKRGVHVVLLAHSWIKGFKNPAGEDYDRYELKLHAKAAGLMREWSDAVLFAQHETYTHERDGRVKGISTGARVVFTQRTAAYDAKNRHDLPEKLPLDWEAFAEAVAAHRPASPAELKAQITELLESATDATKQRVNTALARVGDDAAQLARIANKLAAEVSIQEGQTT